MKKLYGTVPRNLEAFFAEHDRVALAFSGGCDSAYLMYAAITCGARIGAYYVASQFQPGFELRDARRLASELGCELRILKTDVLESADVRANGGERCYFCKRLIFGQILREAAADGFDTLIDGTNASDPASERPGMRAIAELNVYSPLRSCGITKRQVRMLSQKAGLFTWNKPAYACLATRIPTNTEITEENLQRIERSEDALARLGFADFRVRTRGSEARIEITEEQMRLMLEKRAEVVDILQNDFAGIVLNLIPRGGSIDG